MHIEGRISSRRRNHRCQRAVTKAPQISKIDPVVDEWYCMVMNNNVGSVFATTEKPGRCARCPASIVGAGTTDELEKCDCVDRGRYDLIPGRKERPLSYRPSGGRMCSHALWYDSALKINKSEA